MEEEDRASEEMDTEKVNNNGNKYRDRVLLSTECIGNLEQQSWDRKVTKINLLREVQPTERFDSLCITETLETDEYQKYTCKCLVLAN